MIVTSEQKKIHSGLKSEFFMQIWHHGKLYCSEFYSLVKYETIKQITTQKDNGNA